MRPDDLDNLNENEKESLRLVIRGFDAKASASELDVTPNIINGRLRSARKKLAVTSSKQAARLLAEHEGSAPNFLVSKKIGIVSKPVSNAIHPLPDQNRVREMQQSYQPELPASSPFLSVPFRKQGERGNDLSKSGTLRAIADLSVKLAFAFAFVCLAAVLVSTLISRT
ncbi:helix-turn-helix transcriptional regulator [Parasphingorhabdus sp.]|uniref:helix-turn-helix transcriptional regulator n=1 Tax=Parasphingorhabdus sp. TaxID=2709688 RepID=UPI003D280AB3